MGEVNGWKDHESVLIFGWSFDPSWISGSVRFKYQIAVGIKLEGGKEPGVLKSLWVKQVDMSICGLSIHALVVVVPSFDKLRVILWSTFVHIWGRGSVFREAQFIPSTKPNGQGWSCQLNNKRAHFYPRPDAQRPKNWNSPSWKHAFQSCCIFFFQMWQKKRFFFYQRWRRGCEWRIGIVPRTSEIEYKRREMKSQRHLHPFTIILAFSFDLLQFLLMCSRQIRAWSGEQWRFFMEHTMTSNKSIINLSQTRIAMGVNSIKMLLGWAEAEMTFTSPDGGMNIASLIGDLYVIICIMNCNLAPNCRGANITVCMYGYAH